MGEAIPDSHLPSSSIQNWVLQIYPKNVDQPQSQHGTPLSHLDVLLCHSLPTPGSVSKVLLFFSPFMALFLERFLLAAGARLFPAAPLPAP